MPAPRRLSPPIPLLLAVWTIPALLSTMETIVFARQAGRPMPAWLAFAAQAPGWYAWALLTPVVVALGRRWRIDRAPRGRALVMHLGCAFAAAGIVSLVNAGVNHFIRPTRLGFATSLWNWFLAGLPANVVAYFGILAVSVILITTLQLRERERDAARLAAQLGEAQMNALRLQLQPHFLFNSLNAVAALIRDRQNHEAVHALGVLSELLRTTLRDQAQMVPLARELAFIERYLEIEQLRFADRLRVELAVPAPVADLLVPTFILQPLVENALKHGISQRRDGGELKIAAAIDAGVLVLTVENDGPPLPPGRALPPNASASDASAGGVGIANTHARLERLYGTAASLTVVVRHDGNGVIATVRLPAGRETFGGADAPAGLTTGDSVAPAMNQEA